MDDFVGEDAKHRGVATVLHLVAGQLSINAVQVLLEVDEGDGQSLRGRTGSGQKQRTG